MSCDACKRLTVEALRRAPCRFCGREAPPMASLEAAITEKSCQSASEHGQAVEAYLRLFVERTGLRIDEIELVQQRHDSADAITFTWHARRRQ